MRIGDIFILLTILSMTGIASATTITVDDSGGADFSTISEAIGVANGGDTILVLTGIYNENIYVNKPLTIKGIDKPTINGINPIELRFNGIVVDGFIIKGAGNGIRTVNSNNNLIKNNTIKLNRNSGIGIDLYDSTGDDIINNDISENFIGINANHPYSGNDIINNNISSNVFGIKISDGLYYNIKDNVVSKNDIGIFTRYNQWSNIKNNIVNLNGIGIEIVDSWGNNNITTNSISNNREYGIRRTGPGEDKIYDNMFNNSNNYDISGISTWNLSKTKGTNIIKGQYIAGNYWTNPLGKGFSDTCIADYEKICETKNILDYNNIDYLPLAKKDNKPPRSIDNLKNITFERTYVNWTWKDPSNLDFVKVMVYINGIFKANVTKGKQYYNASGLTPNTYYRISTHTVDNNGNINQTWKNHTAITKSLIPSIMVAYPNGGEKFVRGTTKTLKWSYSGNPGSYVKIDLLKGGVLNRIITYSTPIGSSGSGYYNWAIPSTQTLGSDYKIRVTSTSNSAYTDASNNNFIISNPYITVISPNGGEYWQRGTTKTITWKSYGNTGAYVKIDLYKGGVFKQTITASTPNDGSHSWYIPSGQTLGTDYKIKITSTSNSGYYDWSNNYFRIY